MTMMIIRPSTKQEPTSEPPPWPADSIVLAATSTALTCTSLFVYSTLGAWRLEAAVDRVDAAALQLVYNALVATGTLDQHLDLKSVDYLSTIFVGLRQIEHAVVVEVWDCSPEPPCGPASVGHRSGYYLRGYGKVVWTAVLYPLPKRIPSSFRYPPVSHEVAAQTSSQYANDPETIQRVRDALCALRPHV
jgi:hypothetical protein